MLKRHADADEAPKQPEKRNDPKPSGDPKDQRIHQLEETLTFLKDNAVHGNLGHVQMIDSVLADKV